MASIHPQRLGDHDQYEKEMPIHTASFHAKKNYFCWSSYSSERRELGQNLQADMIVNGS
jgi:hypothetical protein